MMTKPAAATGVRIGLIRVAEGKTVEEMCRSLGIADSTYHRWRNTYGGMKTDEVKRLRELEKENERLKKLVADLSLDNQILKEAARGN